MMGDSAGRSGANPTGAGATRRATPRERQKIDAPREPEEIHFITKGTIWLWSLGWFSAGVGAGGLLATFFG